MALAYGGNSFHKNPALITIGEILLQKGKCHLADQAEN
jgi:hypothetical protein